MTRSERQEFKLWYIQPYGHSICTSWIHDQSYSLVTYASSFTQCSRQLHMPLKWATEYINKKYVWLTGPQCKDFECV
jgi:hypothetical protein